MGMEILLYRFKNGERQEKEKAVGKPMADWIGSDWDIIDPNNIWYGCGYDSLGVRVFNEYADRIDEQSGTISRESAKRILEMCLEITDKYRIIHENALQFPVSYIKQLITEAEENNEYLITLPFEDLSDSDEYVDDWDYTAARSLAEAIQEALDNWSDDELYMILSY